MHGNKHTQETESKSDTKYVSSRTPSCSGAGIYSVAGSQSTVPYGGIFLCDTETA